MKLYIETVVKEETLLNLGNSFTIESEYGWYCTECGDYTKEFVMEEINILRDLTSRRVIINRTLDLHNDGEDWLCDNCRSPNAKLRRLLSKKFD